MVDNFEGFFFSRNRHSSFNIMKTILNNHSEASEVLRNHIKLFISESSSQLINWIIQRAQHSSYKYKAPVVCLRCHTSSKLWSGSWIYENSIIVGSLEYDVMWLVSVHNMNNGPFEGSVWSWRDGELHLLLKHVQSTMRESLRMSSTYSSNYRVSILERCQWFRNLIK